MNVSENPHHGNLGKSRDCTESGLLRQFSFSLLVERGLLNTIKYHIHPPGLASGRSALRYARSGDLRPLRLFSGEALPALRGFCVDLLAL
jgi:hypothetical protein